MILTLAGAIAACGVLCSVSVVMAKREQDKKHQKNIEDLKALGRMAREMKEEKEQLEKKNSEK